MPLKTSLRIQELERKQREEEEASKRRARELAVQLATGSQNSSNSNSTNSSTTSQKSSYGSQAVSNEPSKVSGQFESTARKYTRENYNDRFSGKYRTQRRKNASYVDNRGNRNYSSDKEDTHRLRDTLTGAGKQWAGGQLSSIGTTGQSLLTDVESIHRAKAVDDNPYYDLRSRENAQGRETSAMDRLNRKEGVDIRNAERAYDLHRDENKYSADYRKLLSSTENAIKKGDTLQESGAQDIERAKEGANGFQKFLIEQGSQLTQWGMDAGLSAIPVIGQALSIASFMNRAGGMASYQARQEGMNPDQQFFYQQGSALAEGLSELTFQSVGALRATYGKGIFSIGDKLVNRASVSGIVNRLGRTELGKSLFVNMARLGGGALEEGLEEVETDLVDPLLKYMIKKSADPNAEFEGWDIKQMGYDFLMGATMGGVLGGVDIPRQVKADLRIVNDDAYNEGYAESLIKQASIQGRQGEGGRTLLTNSEILAEQFQRQIDSGKPLQPAQIRMLQEAIGQSTAQNEEQLTRRKTEEYTKAEKSGNLVQMQGTRMEDKGIDTASQKLVVEATEKAKSVIGENASEEDAEAVASVTTGLASASDIDTVLAKPELKKAVETIMNEGNASSENAVSIPINNAEARDTLENLTAVNRIANRNTILKGVQEKNAETIKASIDGMSESGKDLFASRADEAQKVIGSADIYRDRFSRLYTDGNTKGADFETSYNRIIGSLDSEALKSVFTKDFAKQIFDEGKKAIITDNAKESARSRAEEYANRKGGLTFENNDENLISAREKDSLQKFAERVGVEINVVKTLAKDSAGKTLMSKTGKKLVVNGKYQNGVITIASDAQNKLITVAKHELTHHLKETSPEMYQKLEDFVFERWYHGNAEEMEDEIARYMKLYSGQGLDRDGVREEIIADASEAFFTDEGAIQDAISFSEKLGRAIHDGIKTMLDAFLGLQDSDSRRTRGYGNFLRDLGILQEAERMWLEALEDSQQRKRNARGNATAEDYVDASTQYTTSDEKHSLVENDDEIERLNSEPTQKSYRAMALIDGKLYPPMATKVKDGNGKWVLQQGADIGQWIKSDITTDHRMFNSKGQFLLKKDNGGSPLEVAYNPYIHSSDVMLNDQFASAHKRPNIVVVEGEIPRSELENGKRAEHDLDDGRHIKAKDPTGTVQWKAGVVQSHLTGTRTVFLTNHFKPTRVVPDSEVARSIQKMVAGTDVVIPYNVVTPSLRQELQKLGVKMEQSKQKGYQVDLNAKYSVTPEDDQTYLDAVNRGDMETAQRMVEKEARKKGYNSPLLFHGTRSFGFTRFDLSHGYDWTPTFATNNKQTAETYSGETNRGKINERSRINIDNLQGEQLLSEAKKHLKRYSDFKVMTESQKANEAEDARNGIKSEIKAFRDFIEDNKYAFDDEKMSITARMIDALNAITEASENDDIWDSWEKYQDAVWDFKWADESLFDEFLKSVNEHSLAVYKNRIDDLTYDGTLFYNDRLGLEYVFDSQVALELDAELHKGIYSLYGNIDNMLVIDAEGSNWNQIIPPDELNLYGVQKTRDIAEEAKSLGYSGVLFKNLKDNGGETAYNGVSDVYVFFNANALKSADPVTYDDDGNVIPLSERFNENNEDIRYSVADQEDLENIGASVTEGGSVTKFSVESWDETDVDQLRQKLIDAGNDPKDVDKWIRDVNSISANIIRNRLTYKADRTHSALKKNSEYYYTLDLSTLCAKRKLYQGTFNAIMHSKGMENVTLLPKDVIHLRALMDSMGYEVPCGICYEESRKKNEPKFAKQWLFGYKTKTTEWAGYANMEHDDPYIPTLADVLTTDGRSMLQAEHPEVLEAYLTFQKGRGSANPKVSRLHTDYRGEILNMTKADIDNVTEIGGLRIQSFSDFEIPHVLDMMQVVLDMSVMGLKSQAYTKVPAFARIFGNTGIKINLSLIVKTDKNGKIQYETYTDENGVERKRLLFDSKEGIDPNEAFELREKYDNNVGTILVGADMESILSAWADPRIDMVIPFHRSGWSKAEFKALGLGGYEDFQAYQSERYILDEKQAKILTEKDKQNTKKKKPHTYKAGETITLAMAKSNGFIENSNELYSNDYWEEKLSGTENAKKYLRLCAEQHRRPVFYEFLQDNGDGSWSLKADGSTDGYWKSLIDFKMYDTKGNFAPQNKVKPVFNMENASDILNGFEGDTDRLPVANDVVEQFVKDYKGGRKYKLVNDKKIVDKDLPKIDTSKFSISDDDTLNKYIVDRQKRIDDGEQMSFFGSLNETLPSKPKEKTKSEKFYDNVLKTIANIKKKGSWSGFEVKGLFLQYPEFNFIERLNNKADETAVSDFNAFLSSFDKIDDLRNYNWYFSAYEYSSQWKKANRSGKMKFNKLIENRIEEIMAGKAHGRNVGIEKRDYTPTEMRKLFNELNTDKELKELGKKVFDCIDKNFDVKFQGVANIEGFKHGQGGTLGQAGGRTVHLNMKYLNSEGYTDQQKASTILHESIHTVTVYALRNRNNYTMPKNIQDACDVIEDVFWQIKNDPSFKGEYGVSKGAEEMVAELANPIFREKLKRKNVFARVIEAIRNILGIEVEVGDRPNAFKEVNKALETLMSNADVVSFERYANRVSRDYNGKFSVSEEDENAPTPKQYQSTIAKLEEKVADLKSEFKRTDLKTPDPKQTRIQAGRLLKRHDSSNLLHGEVVDTFNKIHRLYKGKGMGAFDEVAQVANDMATRIVDNMYYIRDENEDAKETVNSIKDYIRNNPIVVTPEMKRNITDWGAFYKRNFGRIKMVNGEHTNLDRYYYQNLEKIDPEFFGEYYNTPAEMLTHIEDVFGKYDDILNQNYEMSTEEMREYIAEIASDIMVTAYDLQTKRTFADKKYEEKVKAVKKAREEALASRDRALEQQRQRFEEKIEAYKKYHKDYKAETKERAEKKRRINQIAGIHKRLLEKLDMPKDTKHLPDGYAPIVSNVLSMFDFTTEGMEKWAERYGEPSKRYRYLDELRKRLEKMSKPDSEETDFGIEVDPDLVEIIEELKADIGEDVRLSDLDSATLEDIYTLFKAFEHQINSYNKAFDERNRQTVLENRDEFLNQMRSKKDRKERQGVTGWLQRQLETNNTTPEDFFHLVGGTPEKLYRSIRKGFDKHIMNVADAMTFIGDTVSGKEAQKWSENVRTYTTSLGDSIKLTDAQLMSIYCLSKREQAQQHMFSEKGGKGIVVAPQKVGKGLKAEEIDRAKVVVSSSDIQKWISQLSDKQKEVADQFQKYLSDDMSKLGNETALKLYGYRKFTEKNYFPIQSSENWLNSTFDFSGGDAVLKNVGMTKAVNKFANNPIVIDDIFTVASKHISTMSLYNSLVPPLTDFQRFWNSKDNDHNTTVKQEFERVYGKPALQYVENFMRDLNGSYKRGFEVEGIDKLMSKYKQASIGLNLRVLFQQPTAIARAGAVMNPVYITKALGASVTTLKDNLKDMREHCPIALWKSWGFYNTDLARDMKSIIMDESKFSDNFSKAYGVADDLTWSVIFKAVRYEVEAQNKNLKVGSDEYWEKVNERASEVFDRTQVVDSPFHRSQNMRAKDNLSKMVTAFMAEPTKTYNMLKTELTLAKREIESGQKGAGVKRASRVVQVFVTNAMLVSASSAVIDALRGVGGSGDDDKDKNWFERFLAHWWSNTKENINPLGLLPLFKDVMSVVQGYDITRMDMQALGRMVKSLQYMGEYIKDPESSKYTLKNEIDYFLQQSAYLVGIPYANIRRDVRGIAFSMAEAVGYDDLFFEEAKFKYQLNEKTRPMWADMYLEAKYKGNSKLAKKIHDYIIDGGLTQDYIDGREKDYAKAHKTESQQQTFDNTMDTLKASPVWNKATSKRQLDVTGLAEKLSVGIKDNDTENFNKVITEGSKYGLTREEYLLYKLAKSAVADGNANTNDEKREALQMLISLNLSEKEKEILIKH